MARSLGIVIPAYDPDLHLLREYVGALDALDPATIRIELDAADEGSREALEAVPATVNAVPDRRGKGAAVTAGFEALETDVYGFVDADGSTPAGHLDDIVGVVRRGDADLAVGSRRHPEAVVDNSQSKTRETLGDGFAWLARRVLPVSLYDYQCGAKAITAEGWAAVRRELYEPGFGWDVEFVAAAGYQGLAVREIPIHWEDQPGSTVPPFRTALELGRTLVRVQRLRVLGTTTGRPLLERRVDRD